jgi:beta-lactamase class A
MVKFHFALQPKRLRLQQQAVRPVAEKESDAVAACPSTRDYAGEVGIFAKNLSTGKVLTLNPDKIFAAASTIKVPVSIVVYEHFYEQADANTRRIYDTGIELMMTVSENEYFADFLDEIEEKIGPEVIREHFSHIGLRNTTIRDPKAKQEFGYSNVTTARDIGNVFEQLYRGKLLNPEKTEFMLQALANTIFGDELARFMKGRRVIHKIGELDNVLADVGIVEGDQAAILISIFIETELNSDYASDYIATTAACLFTALSGETPDAPGDGSRYD